MKGETCHWSLCHVNENGLWGHFSPPEDDVEKSMVKTTHISHTPFEPNEGNYMYMMNCNRKKGKKGKLKNVKV